MFVLLWAAVAQFCGRGGFFFPPLQKPYAAPTNWLCAHRVAKGPRGTQDGEEGVGMRCQAGLTQIKHCTALMLKGTFERRVEKLVVHHPEGKFMAHIFSFLF